jgi:hypothetical protein
MGKRGDVVVRLLRLLCVLSCICAPACGQVDAQLTANRRLLPAIGPGLRAIRLGSDGRTYVLASPSPGLLVFDRQSKELLSIQEVAAADKTVGGNKAQNPTITYAEDCDVDAQGNIYVADRGANAIEVFSGQGTLLRSSLIDAPISVAVLPEGEVAVATLREPKLVVVFDKNGRDVREFGDPDQLTDRADLNRFLNIGRLTSDAEGRLYYAFTYTPEPTVRRYDRHGYGGLDIQYLAPDAAPEAQAVRREIRKQETRGSAPNFKRVLSAVGIDPVDGELWMALGNTLLRFDNEGSHRETYQLYTPKGARLEANTILVEKEHLLIGNDPLGIYEFNRPEKNR